MAAQPRKKTAKKTSSSKQSAARQWKRSVAEEIDLPSGNMALVKRPGMEVFLLEGLIPDRLMPIVQESINSGKGIAPQKVNELIQDKDNVQSMFEAMDRIVARIVIEPKVLWHRRPVDPANPDGEMEDIPEEDRDAETYIYTDEVFFEDKSFLFQYAVGGTRDLERFRETTDEALASLAPGEGVSHSAE